MFIEFLVYAMHCFGNEYIQMKYTIPAFMVWVDEEVRIFSEHKEVII